MVVLFEDDAVEDSGHVDGASLRHSAQKSQSEERIRAGMFVGPLRQLSLSDNFKKNIAMF